MNDRKSGGFVPPVFFVIFIGSMKIDALSLFMNLQKEIDRL